MAPAGRDRSRVRCWSPLLAVALALGATPGAGAAGHGSGAPVPDRPSVDHTIDRLTAKTRAQRQDRAAWTALGDAFMQKARETADASYYGRAEQAFERARALDAVRRRGDRRAGVGAERAPRVREVDRVGAGRRWRSTPTNAAAYGLLGDAALELGDYDLAAEHYQRMLDLRPDIAAYSRSAHLLFVTGDVRRAIVAHGQGDRRRRPVRREHRLVPGAARADASGDRQPAGRRADRRAGDQPGRRATTTCCSRRGASGRHAGTTRAPSTRIVARARSPRSTKWWSRLDSSTW